MLRIPNAFNYRAADQSSIETDMFLELYSPVNLLANRAAFNFVTPRLITFKGSPGSGKSSVLRLFDTSTLIALSSHQAKGDDSQVVELLRELNVLDEDRPRAFGIYLHCDSSLRDLNNLEADGANLGLLNALLDVRIITGFIRSLDLLNLKFDCFPDLEGLMLPGLASEDLAPELFRESQSVATLRRRCKNIERDFAAFLNSFPGDERPQTIIPHARIYSIKFLADIRRSTDLLTDLLPIIMIDDLHELYPDQRDQVFKYFVERSPLPRWIAVRKQVDELEILIDVEGVPYDRDYQDVYLDSVSTEAGFRKFAANVADKRVRMSSDLNRLMDMRRELAVQQQPVKIDKIRKHLAEVVERIRILSSDFSFEIPDGEEIEFETLVGLEARLIVEERNRKRSQPKLFADSLPTPVEIDAKVRRAAELFASRRYKLPYYFSFDTLADSASGNVEQFLSIASPFADKWISRIELERDTELKPTEQEKILRTSAEDYFQTIRRQLDHGYSIEQLVDNLGLFFNAVTYRASAPFAPGVNGFAFTSIELRKFLDSQDKVKTSAFRNVLTRAVAGNVLFVKETNQGKTGTENVIFYLNRLLCIKYDLPLGLGGFQHIAGDLLLDMMSRPVEMTEWRKRWVEPLLGEETD